MRQRDVPDLPGWTIKPKLNPPDAAGLRTSEELPVDAYFAADVETDGPIPGPGTRGAET